MRWTWPTSLATNPALMRLTSVSACTAPRSRCRRILPERGLAAAARSQRASRRHPRALRSGYGTLARLARIRYLLSVWGSDVYEFPYRSRTSLRIVRRNLRGASALASTSECMAEQVRRVLVDPMVPITVTPFGVDLSRFDPDRLPARAASQPFLIGNIKALSEPYGIDVLIRAAGLLRDRLPGVPFKVRVYGDGPLRSEMQRTGSRTGTGRCRPVGGAIPRPCPTPWLSWTSSAPPASERVSGSPSPKQWQCGVRWWCRIRRA